MQYNKEKQVKKFKNYLNILLYHIVPMLFFTIVIAIYTNFFPLPSFPTVLGRSTSPNPLVITRSDLLRYHTSSYHIILNGAFNHLFSVSLFLLLNVKEFIFVMKLICDCSLLKTCPNYLDQFIPDVQVDFAWCSRQNFMPAIDQTTEVLRKSNLTSFRTGLCIVVYNK